MIKLKSSILGTEIFSLMVDTQLSKDGTPLTLTGPTVTGTTFTYTTQLNSFQRRDYGSYNCTATVRPLQSLSYLLGTDILSDTLIITPSKRYNNVVAYCVLQCYNVHCTCMGKLFLLQLMSGPFSPVHQPQWRSAGVLQLREILILLDTGSSMAMDRMHQYHQ